MKRFKTSIPSKTGYDGLQLSLSAMRSFFGHGTDNPWDEAVSLVLPVLHMPIDAPKEIMHARVTQSEKSHLIGYIKARIEQRIPVAYLTNQAWFAGMPFYVDERVLVPRSPFAELIAKHFFSLGGIA